MPRAAKWNWIRVPEHLNWYSQLHMPKVIDGLRYRYNKHGIIYGIRCLVTDMMYIGSTMDSVGRFNKHLIAKDSNLPLQTAIQRYGLSKFKVYVFEDVTFPQDATYEERKELLQIAEQRYIDLYPKDQLFNTINAVQSK